MSKLEFYSISKLVIVVYFLSNGLIYGQNLVPNPTFTFEKPIATINYPNELQKELIVPEHWEIIGGYPDFYNNTSSTYIGHSLLNSDEGSGAKLGMRMATIQNEFEAVETKLSSELISGRTYKLSFTLAQCQYSNFSMNMIPFILSNEKVVTANVLKSQDQHLYFLETNNFYQATDGWVTVSCFYQAKGGEKYLTLLNDSFGFSAQKQSQFNRLTFNFSGNQLENTSYYLFNKISVELVLDETDKCAPLVIHSDLNLLKNDTKEMVAMKLEILGNNGLIKWDEKKIVQDNLLSWNHIFLIDISGSMADDFKNTQEMILAILKNIPDNETVSLIVFSDISSTIFVHESKEKVMNSVRNLVALGETNLEEGLISLNSLLDAREPTVVHIVTDAITGVDDYFQRTKTHELLMTQKSSYYLQYRSIVQPVMISRMISKGLIIDSLYKNNNYEKYIQWNYKDLDNFYSSKECSNIEKKDSLGKKNEATKATNYVYLIDISSSMDEDHKLEQLKKSIIENNTELNISNKVSLVSFSSTTNVLLNSVPMNDEIFNATIGQLEAKGATKINDGIKYIYNHYGAIEHENISFILFTDGLFVLSEEAEKMILNHPKIHLIIFQFGDKKNKHLEELTKNNSLRYRKIDPKKINENLKLADKEFGFPSQYSESQPEVWKYFQKNLLQITGYHD